MPALSETKHKRHICRKVSYALANENNSCYIDSLMVALFHGQQGLDESWEQALFGNGPVKHLHHQTHKEVIQLTVQSEKIKREIQRISRNMLVHQSDEPRATLCRNLRYMLARYQLMYTSKVSPTAEVVDWKNDQLEPLDILRTLQSMFVTSPIVQVRKEILVSNSTTKKPRSSQLKLHDSSLIADNFIDIISPEDLNNDNKDEHGHIKLQRFYPQSTRETPPTDSTKGYKRRFERLTRITTPLLFIHVTRIVSYDGMNVVKNTTPVLPLQEMKLGDGNILKLSSIILHHGGATGGHYTCVYKCGHNFYEYNDVPKNKVRYLGSFNDVKEFNNGYILRNAVSFVYKRST